MSAAKKASAGGPLKVYPSRTQDPKKNPLDPDMKISFMKKMFPDYEENIINDSEMKSIFNVLQAADGDGYSNVNIVVGSDRQAEFENLATKYNGELYNFDQIRVISAGVRDADAEGVEGMSASKMRKAVMDDDFESFRKGTPKNLDDGDTQALFDAVRTGMGVKKKKKEVAEMWEIAPKFDARGLREQYVNGLIYRIGDVVENLNTGLIGKIIRRGTNHLICVTKEDYMFKSWIRDVMEAVVNYPGPCGVPADQREVGTDAYRQYAMRMTGTKEIKNFINKYKKKSRTMSTNPLNDISKVYLESVAESHVPGKPAEKLGAVTGISKADQMSAAERIKKKTAEKKAALEKKHGKKMDDHPEYPKKKYVDEKLDPVGQEDKILITTVIPISLISICTSVVRRLVRQ